MASIFNAEIWNFCLKSSRYLMFLLVYPSIPHAEESSTNIKGAAL